MEALNCPALMDDSLEIAQQGLPQWSGVTSDLLLAPQVQGWLLRGEPPSLEWGWQVPHPEPQELLQEQELWFAQPAQAVV